MKIDLKYCVVTIKADGAHESVVKVGDGTITWSEKRNIEYVRDRGLLDTTREGDQEPVDVRMDITYEELRGAGTVVTPYEALTKTGAAATWLSSSADPCEPDAVDIEIVFSPPCGTANTETILIADFRYESIDADPKAGTLSVSGKANVTRPAVTQA